ncbi:RNA helicase [Malassezia sp. CBS 17886]|nr:RNA helicase [Malassezia sp. CBS 17886]
MDDDAGGGGHAHAPRRRAHHEDAFQYSYEDEEAYVPYVPVKQRRREAIERAKARARNAPVPPPPANAAVPEEDAQERRRQAQSLLQEARSLRERELAAGRADKTQAEKDAEEEHRILEAHAARRRLASHAELARDIQYTEPIRRSWCAPRFVRERTAAENAALRAKHHVAVDGVDVPPLITNFRDMKVPAGVLEHLRRKNIQQPTPIQMQGLPTALSGRDMIGIAFTGSGKSLTFCLPLVMFSVEAERRLPFAPGEGPLGMVMCPSRELARQTYESIRAMALALEQDGYASIGVLLCIGGINMAEQAHVFRRGLHIVVATPGRLQDMLEKKRFGLASCTYFCLDEADRMIDMGFEDDMRNIMNYFTRQRQMLLFSATMPKKILDFAGQSLLRPVLVNVGRAGAASLDVVQEVEFVKHEAKMAYLLECLQKTPPPVLIFSDNKSEVDDIHEYLLRKGIEAVAIHGSKAQDEREFAVQSFQRGRRDVMVASGVASKGLDFTGIQHVINYTMPKEIEDYVHQIGRTGRSGKTGLATTFVNTSSPEQTLLDLKYLLMEAKQRYVPAAAPLTPSIPPFLASIADPRAASGGRIDSCAMCGGLGHSVRDCPKLEDTQRRIASTFSRADAPGGY